MRVRLTPNQLPITSEEVELATMKFSSALQFNAVPEWREHYIDYDKLKDLIFTLEYNKQNTTPQARADQFRQAVDLETTKVNKFFHTLEPKILGDVNSLLLRLSTFLPSAYEDTDDIHQSESSDDESPLQRRPNFTRSVSSRLAPFENVKLRRETANAYVIVHELLSFIENNREAVRKIYKKFDKVHGTSIMNEELAKADLLPVFNQETTAKINKNIGSLVSDYAKLTETTLEEASEALSRTLREHVIYERNTVWRDLIGLERQAPNSSGAGGAQVTSSSNAKRKSDLRSKIYTLLGIFSVFFLLLIWEPLEVPEHSKCLALVILASMLWATEALPLFVTGFLVPFLVVVLRIFVDKEGKPLEPRDAAPLVFSYFWSPVIQILIGGFTLAAALSKYGIAKSLAQSVLSRTGKYGPRATLLVFMLLSAFLCMWISNVAAPVLMFSVAQPLLRNLPTEDPFNKALLLSIALSSNIGGITSPIASPQNLIALQNTDPVPGWGTWFAVALPVAFVSILGIWAWLCVTYPVSSKAREAVVHASGSHGSAVSSLTWTHYYILFTTGLTIFLWCISRSLESVTGNMGILAILPIVMLFGTNILSSSDFNNFLWTIVALTMGGTVMGKSVESCGLLTLIATNVQRRIQDLPLFAIVVIFGLIVLVLASFISHTVAALIILPLVKSIGEHLAHAHPNLLVVLSALLCSGAMALPTSGIPNVTAVCMTDEFGSPYLTAKDFMSRGIPASVIAYIAIISVGFISCMMIGW